MHATKALGRALLALATALCVVPAAASTRLGESCDLAVLGARDAAGFMRFDRALREAAQGSDAQALDALLQFPLALNRGASRTTIADAAAWHKQFDAAWWPLLQRAVAGQQPQALFCNAEGVMYGDGAIWANPAGGEFRISAINLPRQASAAGGHAAAAPSVLLDCGTEKVRIVIDAAGGGAPRYRSWNRPHAPPEAPALELAGKADGEGTGSCHRRIWRFSSGNVRYIVGEPGCTDGSVPPDAKARLEVEIAGKPALDAWCR